MLTNINKCLLKIYKGCVQVFNFIINEIVASLKFLYRYRLFLMSTILSLLSMLLTYIWLNQAFDYDAGEEHLTWANYFRELLIKDDSSQTYIDSITFINIGNDQVLTPVLDDIGLDAGTHTVTDREKLRKFLKRLNSIGTHQMIFLDINFDEELPGDSLLANVMSQTKNIYIPKTSNVNFSDSNINQGGVSGVKTILSGDFFKFPFILNKEKSIPVKLFELLDGGSFEKKGFMYFHNDRFAFNSIVPNFYIRDFSKYNLDKINNYFDLGSDILTVSNDLSLMIKDRIVVIGALTEFDQHNTFVGKIPGLLIILNSYYNLKYSVNVISVWMIIVFFVVYFFISIHILSPYYLKTELKPFLSFSKLKVNKSRLTSFFDFIKSIKKNRIIWYLLTSISSLIKYPLIFLIFIFAIKLIFNVYLNLLLVAIYFAFVKYVVDFVRFLKSNNNYSKKKIFNI